MAAAQTGRTAPRGSAAYLVRSALEIRAGLVPDWRAVAEREGSAYPRLVFDRYRRRVPASERQRIAGLTPEQALAELQEPEAEPAPPASRVEQAGSAETVADLAARLRQGRLADRDRTRFIGLERMLREFNTWEDLKATLTGIVQALPPIDMTPPAPPADSDVSLEIAACVGDCQIGERVLPEETGGIGLYGFGEFKIRLRRYLSHLQRIVRLHSAAHPVARLHLPFIGDSIEGIGIYKSQVWHLDRDLMDQVIEGARELAWFVAQASALAPQTEVWCIPGNHGRVGEKGANPRHINMDRLVYYVMSLHLKDYPHIHFHDSRTPWQFAEFNGACYGLAHGDTFKAWNGIPYYGAGRAFARFQGIAAEQNIFLRGAIFGHHHQSAMFEAPGGEVFMNGTFVGGSEFSINELHVAGYPTQLVMGILPRTGVDFRYRVRLDVDAPSAVTTEPSA